MIVTGSRASYGIYLLVTGSLRDSYGIYVTVTGCTGQPSSKNDCQSDRGTAKK